MTGIEATLLGESGTQPLEGHGGPVLVLALAAATLLGVVALALSRVFTRLSSSRDALVRSFAGGVCLAFVTLDLFVELVEGSAGELHDVVRMGPEPVHTVAILLLLGTLSSVISAAYLAHRGSARQHHATELAPHVVYSALVGAAVDEEAHEGPLPLLLFWVAMAIHLGVVDHRLAERFPREHGLSAAATSLLALAAGAIVWAVFAPPRGVFHLILAIVAGGTLLGVFREELPSARETRILPIVGGTAVFGVLAQLRWWL